MANLALKDNPNDANSHYILSQEATNKKDWNTALTECFIASRSFMQIH